MIKNGAYDLYHQSPGTVNELVYTDYSPPMSKEWFQMELNRACAT